MRICGVPCIAFVNSFVWGVVAYAAKLGQYMIEIYVLYMMTRNRFLVCWGCVCEMD